MITLSTDKDAYWPGETVTVEISTHFEKQVKARRLAAALVCRESKLVKTTTVKGQHDYREEQELGIPRSTHLETTTSEHNRDWFRQEKTVSEGKEFGKESFKVQFSIPQNAPPTSHEFGHDDLIHVWRIEIKLDIPFALDQHAEKEVSVQGLG